MSKDLGMVYPREELIRFLSKYKVVGGKSLDVGCGSGRYSKLLRDMGYGTVVGIDIEKNIPIFYESMNEYIVKDIRNGIDVDEVDTVIVDGVLDHLCSEDIRSVFGMCVKSMKRGGSIFISLSSSVPSDKYIKTEKLLDGFVEYKCIGGADDGLIQSVIEDFNIFETVALDLGLVKIYDVREQRDIKGNGVFGRVYFGYIKLRYV